MKTKCLVILLAAAMTAANAGKPPVIDDTAYLALAQQIAKAPFNPYGFEQFWYDRPQPANEVLAPPVVPYWLALGMRVIGDDPVALKLWLFPFALIFCFAMHDLLRRFAPGVELPVLAMTVFSPAILPAFCFMLDVPAYALSLSAVAIMLRALDRRSAGLAVAAGVCAGLAAQTKYTGLLVPPILLACSLMRRRIAFGILACVVAGGLFVAWESFVHFQHGESHFRTALRLSPMTLEEKLAQAGPILTLLGATGPPVAMLGLTALRVPLAFRTVFAILVAAGYAFMAIYAVSADSWWWPDRSLAHVSVATPTFTVVGLVSMGIFLIVEFRILFRFRRRPIRLTWSGWFLAIWLLIELVGFVGMAQFPAVRRVMGLTLVSTILTARLASMSCRGPRRRGVWLAVIPGALLGWFYTVVDWSEARVEPEAVRQAAAYIRQHDAHPTVWYTGHWGFQYEANRNGMKAFVPEQSQLQPGDWLIVPEKWFNQQTLQPGERPGEPVHFVRVMRSFPLRTVPAYYGGGIPMEPWSRMRLEVAIYRAP